MIRAGVTVEAKAAFFAGEHRSDHTYRMALYKPSASLGPNTVQYTPRGEVDAPGYKAGGIALSGWSITKSGRAAELRFDSATWSVSSIRAKGALVYNASHPEKLTVAVLDFGEVVKSHNGPFVVSMRDQFITLQ